MRLYAGSSEDFIADSVHNRIADKIKTAFFGEFRYHPSPGEVSSWRNSLRALSQVFQVGNFMGHGILLEYKLPQTSKRLDCLITGRDNLLNDHATIIELKQWETCEESDADQIVTFVAGNNRDVLHPSAQVPPVSKLRIGSGKGGKRRITTDRFFRLMSAATVRRQVSS